MEEKSQKPIAFVSCKMTAKENVNSDLLNLHSTTFSSECEIEGELKDLLHRCYNLGTLRKVTFTQPDIMAYGIRNFEGYFKNGRR